MDTSDLERLITKLEASVEDTNPQKGYWKAVWDLVGEIRAGMRESRYPTRDEKEAARKRFDALVERAKKRSEDNKARMEESKRVWEDRVSRSERARNEIQSEAFHGRPISEFAQMIADLVTAPVRMVVEAVLRLIGIEPPSRLQEIKQDLQNCSQVLRETWSNFSRLKDEMLPGDRQQAFKALREAQDNLDDAWARWKEAMNEAWKRNQEAWEARRAEREEKHRNFVSRVRENISKNEARLRGAQEALVRNQARLEDLIEKRDTARSDEWRDRFSDWVTECEEKISDIEENIDQIQGWIDEDNAKLD